MRYVIMAALLVASLVHLVPLVGVLGIVLLLAGLGAWFDLAQGASS